MDLPPLDLHDVQVLLGERDILIRRLQIQIDRLTVALEERDTDDTESP